MEKNIVALNISGHDFENLQFCSKKNIVNLLFPNIFNKLKCNIAYFGN